MHAKRQIEETAMSRCFIRGVNLYSGDVIMPISQFRFVLCFPINGIHCKKIKQIHRDVCNVWYTIYNKFRPVDSQ